MLKTIAWGTFYQLGYNCCLGFFFKWKNHIIWGHVYHHTLLIQAKQLDPKYTFPGAMLDQVGGEKAFLPKAYNTERPQPQCNFSL